jgi:hypothetical protein
VKFFYRVSPWFLLNVENIFNFRGYSWYKKLESGLNWLEV